MQEDELNTLKLSKVKKRPLICAFGVIDLSSEQESCALLTYYVRLRWLCSAFLFSWRNNLMQFLIKLSREREHEVDVNLILGVNMEALIGPIMPRGYYLETKDSD